jgi:hypothetical protein
MKLKIASNIEIKFVIGKGYGVFATEAIKVNTIIEECRLISLYRKSNAQIYDRILPNYIFGYPKGSTWENAVLPMGYGCIYNHNIEPNTAWRDHPCRHIAAFQFFTIKDVAAGEELCTYYGDSIYWNKAQSNIKMM